MTRAVEGPDVAPGDSPGGPFGAAIDASSGVTLAFQMPLFNLNGPHEPENWDMIGPPSKVRIGLLA